VTNPYYDLADENPKLAALWDSYHWLPNVGDNLLFDKFCQDKHVSRDDLAAIGTKMTDAGELAWHYSGGIKYRKLTGERRAVGTLNQFKLVTGQPIPVKGLIVAEGETDAAALHRACPNYTIGIMPAGAKAVSGEMAGFLEAAQANKVAVYLALDADEAGDAGAAKMPGIRLRPPEPHNDWAEALSDSAVAASFDPICVAKGPPKITFSFQEIIDADLGSRADTNYFAHGIVPVRGSIMIHGAMKSLKSFVLMEIVRALACGDQFAGYVDYIHPDPARVLLFQYEVLPQAFQERIAAARGTMTQPTSDLFLANAGTYKIGDNELPRLKADQPKFMETILEAAEEFSADVLAFDPIQRMTGKANTNQSHELEVILDTFDLLRAKGFTVVYCHHNNKQSDPRRPTAASGSQRFGADQDSICSLVYDTNAHGDDENPGRVKSRDLLWTLRNDSCHGRGITVKPDPLFDDLAVVEWSVPFRGRDTQEDDDF
jgi:hypothetical protein